MSRVPRALAKRIDRLSVRAHAFHRFAHHPLCGSYRGEVVELGRKTRVCRGCLAAGLGLVSGVILGLGASPGFGLEACMLLGAAALGLSSLALRLPKFVCRYLPAALGAAATTAATRGILERDLHALGVVGVALLLGCGGFIVYRRRGPYRSACEQCPERNDSRPCSGLAPIVRRERAFQRLSQRWLDAIQK